MLNNYELMKLKDAVEENRVTDEDVPSLVWALNELLIIRRAAEAIADKKDDKAVFLRLDEATVKLLDDEAARSGATKKHVVREALRRMLAE